jgi:CheY-like chemotaxis protein
MNLCINARDAMPDGGRLTLTAHVEPVDEAMAKSCGAPSPGAHVVLGVEDTGAGIPPDVLDKIFDPFFTTKPVGKGTGLGLSTALGIVRNHRGFIRVDSLPDRGTRFEIYLPVSKGGPAAEPPVRSAAPPAGRGECILLVDDEEQARQITRRMLERNSYHVLDACNGQEALAIFERDPARIHLVVTDLMMPVMDGGQLICRLRERSPDVKIIAITGGLSREEMANVMESESAAFILKPFGANILLETIRRVLRA